MFKINLNFFLFLNWFKKVIILKLNKYIKGFLIFYRISKNYFLITNTNEFYIVKLFFFII